MGYSASQDQRNQCSPAIEFASQRSNPHLPQVSSALRIPTAICNSGSDRTRPDDTYYTTGMGDTDSTFRKTANAMFFCATNPDPGANGSVWALLQNGDIQRMEEAQERGSLGAPPAYTG